MSLKLFCHVVSFLPKGLSRKKHGKNVVIEKQATKNVSGLLQNKNVLLFQWNFPWTCFELRNKKLFFWRKRPIPLKNVTAKFDGLKTPSSWHHFWSTSTNYLNDWSSVSLIWKLHFLTKSFFRRALIRCWKWLKKIKIICNLLTSISFWYCCLCWLNFSVSNLNLSEDSLIEDSLTSRPVEIRTKFTEMLTHKWRAD